MLHNCRCIIIIVTIITQTGLTKAVQESTISLSQTEEMMVMFVQEHTPKGKCPLAGNSVHCDKAFLNKYMQRFMAHLHYRIVDVSTVKELCRSIVRTRIGGWGVARAVGHFGDHMVI